MDVIGDIPSLEYYNWPHQMAYHNLCKQRVPPTGAGKLLGLGL